MSQIWIKNAKTITGVSIHLEINQGRISRLHSTPVEWGNFAIDASGLTVLPGLTDIQVHFRDPGFPEKETLQTGSEAAAAGGFTRVVCMANTNPVLDTADRVADVLARARAIGICEVFPCGTVTKGLLGQELTDFAALKLAGAIAVTDDGKGIQSDEVMERAFILAAKVGIPILDHAECDAINKHGVISNEALAKQFALSLSDPRAEEIHVRRGCELSLKTGAHYHALHVSTKGAVEAIRAAKTRGANVTGEVCPHHFILSSNDIPMLDGRPDPNFKMNPPLRALFDRDACLQGLVDGVFDAISTDHAPHALAEKKQGFEKAPFGIVGLETCFPLSYSYLVEKKLISLTQLVSLLNDGPSRVMGFPANKIELGATANLTFVDLSQEFLVDPAQFKSRSRNTPFAGWKLKGRPKLTLFQGNISHVIQQK